MKKAAIVVSFVVLGILGTGGAMQAQAPAAPAAPATLQQTIDLAAFTGTPIMIAAVPTSRVYVSCGNSGGADVRVVRGAGQWRPGGDRGHGDGRV